MTRVNRLAAPRHHGSAVLLGCKEYEIEPGRSVVNNWERELFEPWIERKARLEAERAEGTRS